MCNIMYTENIKKDLMTYSTNRIQFYVSCYTN